MFGRGARSEWFVKEIEEFCSTLMGEHRNAVVFNSEGWRRFER